MMLFLFIFLLVFALGGGGWGYSRYGAAGGLGPVGIAVLVMVGLWLTGNLHA